MVLSTQFREESNTAPQCPVVAERPSHLVHTDSIGVQHSVCLHSSGLILTDQRLPVDIDLGVGWCPEQQDGGRLPERYQHMQRVLLGGGRHVSQRVGVARGLVLQLVHTGGVPLASDVQLWVYGVREG